MGCNFRDTAREAEEDFSSAGARSDDNDDARSIRTIVPHELERWSRDSVPPRGARGPAGSLPGISLSSCCQ